MLAQDQGRHLRRRRAQLLGQQGPKADRVELRPQAENLLVLGIGGSALGNIALQSALNLPMYNLFPRQKRGAPRLFVLDNVDPVLVDAVLELVSSDWSRTYVNVISKSGETAETSAQFLIVRDRLIQALGEDQARQRIIVTTDTSTGTMRKEIMDKEHYRSLAVPDDVGGRFSVLSPVGTLPAALLGFNVDAMMAGAREAVEQARRPFLENPALAVAFVQFVLEREKQKKILVLFPYSQALWKFAFWFKQLWGESLGKKVDRRGREVQDREPPRSRQRRRRDSVEPRLEPEHDLARGTRQARNGLRYRDLRQE